ncbi:MAG: hypothetical protein O9282_14810 [Flavobacterium sp.]|jgi:hypothetical protein|uniref:hypothetical protein n=1 Tax=Flavobacterium sp. TaxID=239 RepID=UPI0022CC7905|nr:hypothetical protein [Flavobacterium sp.]MCZ8023860.1 hypothetical protein [Cytophagales bacterium]MCZ8332578.1 hypothetical protein [Flavobacterium sp.]
MKILLFIFIISFTPIGLFGQSKYGFGLVVVKTFSPNGKVSKQIFFSEVVNLDSLFGKSTIIKKLERRNKRYFDLMGKWVVETISSKYGDILEGNPEIVNMSQIEKIPDHRNIKMQNDKLPKDFKRADRRSKTIFMDKLMAELRRIDMLEIAELDIDGKVIIL